MSEEEVSVYGISDGSRYVKIPDLKSLKEDEVYLSEPFCDKYGLKTGDTILLDEKEFGGYLSDSEITDIQDENIATVITERDITKMCDQLDHSMGVYMQYFQFLCILLSAVLIYLLTKIIIEKNENAISMVKILGYERCLHLS